MNSVGIWLEKFCVLLFHGQPEGRSNVEQSVNAFHTKGKAIASHGGKQAEEREKVTDRSRPSWHWKQMLLCLAQVLPLFSFSVTRINKCSFEKTQERLGCHTAAD